MLGAGPRGLVPSRAAALVGRAAIGEATEAAELERDRRIVAGVAAKRRAEGKPWTVEIEARMLADRAARRRTTE